ncbi:MAG: WG repeat-containing protein [Peptostreptococcaceae bacterium]|nr:WG repeat-containing protein [Peptostreptococcaceae bacterium]
MRGKRKKAEKSAKRTVFAAAMILVMTIFAMILGLRIHDALKASDVESAILAFEQYAPPLENAKKLSRQDIEEIVDLINSPKENFGGYSTGKHDAVFLIEMDMKGGRKRFYKFIFNEDGSVNIVRKPSMDDSDFDYREWSLQEEEAKKAFDMPAFGQMYTSSNPIFPIVYAEGIELIGSKRADFWEYKNRSSNWRASDFSPLKQEKTNVIRGNTINILFPLYPKHKEYALYDSKNQKVQGGELTRPQLRLPDKKENYRLELTAEWDYEGSLAPYLGIVNEERPNSVRGKTTTVIELRREGHTQASEQEKDISYRPLLVSLEDSLKRLGAEFSIDYEKKNCIVSSPEGKKETEVAAEEMKTEDLQRKEFEFQVAQSKALRDFYFTDRGIYVDALRLAYDLGMVLKKNKNGRYIYQENKILYPMRHSSKKEGYINWKGNWKIPPVFRNTGNFDGDYSIFSIAGEISAEDNERILNMGDLPDDLREDLINFHRPTLDGLIDLNGKIIMPAGEEFYYLGGNILYSASEDSVTLSFLDESRELNIESDALIVAVQVGEGRILVKSDSGDFYLDLAGKPLHSEPLDFASPFSCQRAVVGKEDKEEGEIVRYGVIDDHFRLKVPYLFSYVDNYSENVSFVQVHTNGINQYAYIDSEGNLLTDLDYEYATAFHDGRALVNLDEERLVYIGKDFQIVRKEDGEPIAEIERNRNGPFGQMPDPYVEEAEYLDYIFSEGFALVRKGEEYGYIDRMGRPLVSYPLSYAKPFKNGMGLAALEEDLSERMTYINTFGESIKIEEIKMPKED